MWEGAKEKPVCFHKVTEFWLMGTKQTFAGRGKWKGDPRGYKGAVIDLQVHKSAEARESSLVQVSLLSCPAVYTDTSGNWEIQEDAEKLGEMWKRKACKGLVHYVLGRQAWGLHFHLPSFNKHLWWYILWRSPLVRWGHATSWVTQSSQPSWITETLV